MTEAKPLAMEKSLVWQAYKRVKAHNGAPGNDKVAIAEFEKNLKGNLYKLWNLLSSGTYFPPPVRAVEIPKSSGGIRVLGIPSVGDRVAQTAAAMVIEPILESHFDKNSFGYLPGRSAHQALDMVRKCCWKYDRVVEFDIKGMFDNISHELLLKALASHASILSWIVLAIQRWITVPIVLSSGEVRARIKGTPQGGVISPLLANLFMHYAFDRWMRREFSSVPFCRYADDGLVHCCSKEQAQDVLARLTERFNEVGLEIHPEKSRVVYCKDKNRRQEGLHIVTQTCSYTGA